MYEDDGESIAVPVITLEVLSDYSQNDPIPNYTHHDPNDTMLNEVQQSSVEHYHATGAQYGNENPNPQMEPVKAETKEMKEQDPTTTKVRTDLLEYMIRNDGSVLCKMCGEILQSRTHWYRHKYKAHAIPPINPAPLFHCEQCFVFFKSRKGYIGHLASRHSEVLADSSPVLTNSQAEALAKQAQTQPEVKDETDPELAIPKTSVPNYQSIVKQATKTLETKKPYKSNNKDQENQADWEERRTREEKLVADIIDRVRRECEAQGSGGAARRGYTRRTTVMHT